MIAKGSGSWAIWHVKAAGLPRLVDDLEKLERTGYPEDKCDALKSALKGIIDTINGASGSHWQPCFSGDIRQFLSIYERWNGRGEGVDPEDRLLRREAIEGMRNVRKNLRKNVKRVFDRIEKDPQPYLSDPFDRKLAEDMYENLAQLVRRFPDTFPILKTAVDAFLRGTTVGRGAPSSGLHPVR